MKWRSLEEASPTADVRSLRAIFAERKDLIAKYVPAETQTIHARAVAELKERNLAANVLPVGAKPFVDDGNSFWALAHVPAITHGPRAGGQHTVSEWVSIDDLARVACLYALTAMVYCREE